MQKTNLNYLFIDKINQFAHLIKTEQQTKSEFLKAVQKNCDLSNPETLMFYIATEKSTFETIRLNEAQNEILFNQ